MSAPCVALHGATVRRGPRVVWSEVDLEIPHGAVVGVLGPNGAGKSTLLEVLLGNLELSAGSVQVLGGTPGSHGLEVGYVPQHREVAGAAGVRASDVVALGFDGHRLGFAWSARARRERSERVAEALDAVGAAPLGARRLGDLSGGERQRLLLAQALVAEPHLLLLDEPFANLDVRQQAEMAELVAGIARARDVTVLIVAHDVNPLRDALDLVCYVAGGSMAVGTPDEVVTTQRLSALYGAPVEVLEDARGRRFVVGLDEEIAHPHGHGHDHAKLHH